MVVGARHDPDAVCVCVVREPLQVTDDALRLGDVQLPVGVHEIVLGVDVPEDDAGHGGESLGGYRSVSTGKPLDAQTRRRTAVNRSEGLRRPVLQPEDDRNLIAAVLSRALVAVRPHLQWKVLSLGGREAKLDEERRFARQGEDLIEAVRAGLEDERLEQRAAESRPLPFGLDRESRDFPQVLGIDLDRTARDDLATGRRLRHYVFLDVPAQVVVTPWQEVAGGDEGRHEPLEARNVCEDRRPQRGARERGAGSGSLRCDAETRLAWEGTAPRSLLPENRPCVHASTSSSIATPRSSSGSVITSGGIKRITSGPAVSTSKPRSRAAATNGAAGSDSSMPHRSPRPRTALTREMTLASRSSRAPIHSPLRRTSASKAGSALYGMPTRRDPRPPIPLVAQCGYRARAARRAFDSPGGRWRRASRTDVHGRTLRTPRFRSCPTTSGRT